MERLESEEEARFARRRQSTEFPMDTLDSTLFRVYPVQRRETVSKPDGFSMEPVEPVLLWVPTGKLSKPARKSATPLKWQKTTFVSTRPKSIRRGMKKENAYSGYR